MSDFEVKCCNKTFLAKRYRVKTYLKDIVREEFKIFLCPVCGALIIERLRENKKGKKHYKRLTGFKAQFYLIGLEYKEILQKKVETGTKSKFNWFYGRNNKRYDHNDKKREDFITLIPPTPI